VGLEEFTTDFIAVEAKLVGEEAKCNVSIAALSVPVCPIECRIKT
jgi:hypothetical protein